MSGAPSHTEPGKGVRMERVPAAVERRHFLASKLSAPPRRPGFVDRPVLTNSLQSASYAGVVLVSAPAGYGKTTLLALWRQRDERPFGWVSLDAADNDPVVPVAGVLAAVDPILHLDPDIRDGPEGPEPPLEEFVLPALVEACIARGQPLVLVLDDVHLVTDRRSHAAIAYLGDQVATCTA